MKLQKLLLFTLTLFLFAASTSFADGFFDFTINDSTLSLTVDTSSLSGTDGFLYFQYNPLNAADSTATISNFLTDGVLASSRASEVDGSAVTGLLPGDVVFANTNAVNDYNQGITFGDSIYFDLLFSNPIPGGQEGGGTTFSMGLFGDEFGAVPIPGFTFWSDLKNDGSIYTPEAGTLWLLGPALLGLFAVRKRISR